MSTEASRICVMSGGDEVRYRTYVNHAVYSRMHGFTYHIGIGLGSDVVSPYYYKFNAIREILPHFEWVLYLDDDVYVTDLEGSQIEELIVAARRNDDFMVVAEGPVEALGAWSRLNSGVMLMKNDPRTFALLDTAQAVDLAEVEATWEEENEGIFTNGDQDGIWRAVRDGGLEGNGVRIVEHRMLNSRSHYYRQSLSDAFAVHFCGPGDKNLKVAEFGRRFGLGQELVPEGAMDRFSVKRRERMSDLEMRRRRADLVRVATEKRVRRKIDFVRSTHRWR